MQTRAKGWNHHIENARHAVNERVRRVGLLESGLFVTQELDERYSLYGRYIFGPSDIPTGWECDKFATYLDQNPERGWIEFSADRQTSVRASKPTAKFRLSRASEPKPEWLEKSLNA